MTATPFRVKAVHDYTSGHEDDLSFANGQIITVTDVEDDDWYYGEYAHDGGSTRQGLFPKNFVERYEPVTPPRPSRATRREHEPDLPPQAAAASSSPAVPVPVQLSKADEAAPEAEQINTTEEDTEDEEEETSQQFSEPPSVAPQARDNVGGSQLPLPRNDPPANIRKTEKVAPAKDTRAPPPSFNTGKSPPSAAAEGPASSSFKDRIAAFNKPAASPLAPAKPGQLQGSSFVKKPFVPPPPSRDAYVPIPREPPPQRIYQREEHPVPTESAEESSQSAAPPTISEEAQDDQPKPTSLKERIALLQKQQLEQATRHAELAAKKEKPKKPPPRKKPEVSHDDEALAKSVEQIQDQPISETAGEESITAPRPPRTSRSKDRTPIASPESTQKDFFSDPNDADQSAGGETEDGESVTAIQAPRQFANRPFPIRQHSGASGDSENQEHIPDSQEREEKAEAEGDEVDEGEDAEEEEVDPEIRRRMEIRERMAKMSGGMGMAGMFGLPGGLPSHTPKKTKPASDGNRIQGDEERGVSGSAQPVPVMALPGMAMLGRSKSKDTEDEISQDEDMASSQPPKTPRQMDHEEEASNHGSNVPSRPLPPLPPVRMVSHNDNDNVANEDDHSAPVANYGRAAPPVPGSQNRKASSTYSTESRPPPPLPPTAAPTSSQIIGTGGDSDDDYSTTHAAESSNINPTHRVPPPLPGNIVDAGSETVPISPISPVHEPQIVKSSTFPQSPSSSKEKRTSRLPPPIPTAAPTAPTSPTMNRGPPPPLPTTRATDNAPSGTGSNAKHEDSEEVTEYEGDYDTDIAPGESYRDALTAEQGSSAEETLTGDEASYHHLGLPSLGPPPGVPAVPSVFAPRGAPPPPPPREPPRASRQSSDLPRSPPPPPPPTQPSSISRQSTNIPRAVPPPVPHQAVQNDSDYDPYNYNAAVPSIPSRELPDTASKSGDDHRYDDLYDSPPPPPARALPPQPPSAHPNLAPSSSGLNTRRSLDTSRAGPARSSMDARPSMDQPGGYMAHEIDVSRSSNWWLQRKMPPPSIQNRSDVAYEIEESTAIQQDGSELTLKHVYVLFMDYSQTTLTARYAQSDSLNAEFTQRYEPPPGPLRQDQLENAHGKFGARIADIANQKVNHVVGNGSPMAFVSELLHNFSDAVPAVGNRTFGAVVYANIANATVQQFDEIRTGDIITFRNAKLQGHKGPMKQKYNIDVGKPDHAAVVVDWDGTKKKIRAWEQGRESKKVKVESFKLGDLKSGEVKIWRVVGRDWVGWGSTSSTS